jgi:predicted nucleotidyltransferase
MLVGSLAQEEDFFHGWSDIDLLVVVSDGEVKRTIETNDVTHLVLCPVK